MISVKTFDNRHFPMRQQSGLASVCIPIRCKPQCLKLKSHSVIKLTFIELVGAEGLNRSAFVSNRTIISDSYKQSFGLIPAALSIDPEGVIVASYLTSSVDGE